MLKTSHQGLYRNLFKSAKVAIFVVEGEHGVVIDSNVRAAELMGVRREDLIGKFVVDLFPADLRPPVKDTLEDLWDEDGVCGYGCRLLTPTGAEVPVRLATSVVVQDDLAYLAIFARPDDARSDEDQVRLQEELRKAIETANRHADEARRAVEGKARFVTQLTHELRTPLNGLIGMSALLSEMDLEGEARRTADNVAASAQSLLDLVNDVLDFARVEAGKAPLRRSPFHLEDLLRGVLGTFAAQAVDQEVRCELQLDRELAPWLLGDGGRLRQVMVNLLGNALRGTSGGTVTIEAVPVDDRVRISVTDTGCGIADADLGRIFEGSEGGKSPSGGTGLGLAISRDLVARMGGQLEATSREGWGSTFTFSLELPATVEPAVPQPGVAQLRDRAVEEFAASAFADKPRNLRILLAEDNKVNQTVALGMMRKLGHEGTAVDDGRHALMALASGDYDVVFMDLQMPELGGLETTRRIRAGEAGERYRDIPIVAMTGHATRRDRQACIEAGMNGYVAKPISSERIDEAIDQLSTFGGVEDSRGAPFTPVKLISQMNGDTDLAAEILGVFREDTAARLTRIADALCNYAFEAVVHEARAIEGGALNVCAEIMVNLSRELLRAAEQKENESAEALVAEMRGELTGMVID